MLHKFFTQGTCGAGRKSKKLPIETLFEKKLKHKTSIWHLKKKIGIFLRFFLKKTNAQPIKIASKEDRFICLHLHLLANPKNQGKMPWLYSKRGKKREKNSY